MKFDEILKELGEFGPYQKRIYIFICIPAASIGSFMILNVVLLGVPEHRCKIPGCNNDTFVVHNACTELPVHNTTSGVMYDQCNIERYTRNEHNVTLNSSSTTCSEWVYDTSVFKNTFTKQENLVCDDAIRISHVQMAFYFGVLVGSFVLGQLADIIGRRKTLYLGFIVLLASSMGLAYAPEFYSFTFLFFLVGTSCIGIFVTSFVLVMEIIGPSNRIWTGLVIHTFGTTGAMYMVLMSYLLRDWHLITLSVAAPCVFFLSYLWILPESARWLLARGRLEEAKTILQKMARKNGTTYSDKMLANYSEGEKRREGRVWHLFSTRTLAIRTVVICINWFIVSMTFYGVVLNVGNIGGDFYLNLFLVNSGGYPATIACILLMNRIGRKKLYVGCMVVGGLACIATLYPVLKEDESLNWLLLLLSVIGKMGASGGFQTIYFLSAELYPTVVRNAGMGTSSACARAGSMLAPYIAQLGGIVGGTVGKALPLAVFRVATFLAAMLCLLLPETLGRRLPDTIEDADKFTSEDFQSTVIEVLPPVSERTRLIRKGSGTVTVETCY